MRLYLVLFPIEDLRLVLEIAKRILTRKKIDRQFFTPCMNIKDGYNSKKVHTFDMQDRLDDKQ